MKEITFRQKLGLFVSPAIAMTLLGTTCWVARVREGKFDDDRGIEPVSTEIRTNYISVRRFRDIEPDNKDDTITDKTVRLIGALQDRKDKIKDAWRTAIEQKNTKQATYAEATCKMLQAAIAEVSLEPNKVFASSGAAEILAGVDKFLATRDVFANKSPLYLGGIVLKFDRAEKEGLNFKRLTLAEERAAQKAEKTSPAGRGL